MKNKINRLFSWILVLVMILSIVYTDAWAAQTTENETEIMDELQNLVDNQEVEEEKENDNKEISDVLQEEETEESEEMQQSVEETSEETQDISAEDTQEIPDTMAETTEVDEEITESTITEEETTEEDSTIIDETTETQEETSDVLDTVSAEEGSVSFSQEYAKVGSELTVNYSGEQTEVSYIWYIDEQKIDCTANTYIPTQNDIEKMIQVEVYKGETKLGEAQMFCSKLPVIYIDTENAQPIVSKEDYISAHLKIQGNDAYNLGNTTLYDGVVNIRGRGNSTWKRFDKKPYKVKLDKSTNLFGMGKNKHWALLANYIDGSLMRNQLSVDISKQIGVEAMDAVWVDVVLNGVCVGNYQLYEQVRISKDRVNVFDWDGAAGDIAKKIVKEENLSDADEDMLTDYMEKNMEWMTSRTVTYNGVTYNIEDYYSELPESTNGGYLMELTTDADEVSMFTTTRAVPIQFKNPEYINTNETAFNWIKNYVQQLEDAIYSADHCTIDGQNHVSYLDYCDSKSLMAYWLSCEMLKNEIGYKSNYFYKADNMPIVFGPVWDFDFSAGSVAPFGSQSTKGWASTGRAWFSECMKDPYFAIKVRELYDANVEYLQSIVDNNGLLDKWYEYLKESGNKDFELWHYSRTIEEDYTVLKNWLKNRIKWMDQQFKNDESTFASLGVPLSARFNLSLSGENILSSEGRDYWGEYKEGQVFELALKVTDGSYPKFNYYVNGRYIAEGDIVDNNAIVAITDDMLTEGLDNKNVISVWLKDGNGTLAEMQCVTLTVISGTKNYYNVTFHDQLENQANVYAQKKLEGGKVLLSDTSLTVQEALFEGWSDGTNTYPKSSYFKVDQDTDLYAVWATCTNGDYYHNWKENGNIYICEDCGKQKEIQKDYIDIASCSFNQSNRYTNTYTGTPVAPIITVQYGGRTLTEGVEYNISFKNNVNVGYATYEITGIEEAGFTGMAAMTYRIVAKNISGITAKCNPTSFGYDGAEKIPTLTLSYKGIPLEEGKDYTVTYQDNINPGTATANIVGIGNFTGTKTMTYTIKETRNLDLATISSIAGKTYTGAEITPTVKVKYGNITLEEGVDYTVSYKDNVNVGKATAIITGIGAYKGQRTAQFNIVAKAVSASDISYTTIPNQIYTRKAITPSVTVKYKDMVLVEGVDYTLSYSNNIEIGKASVKITGIGNYRSNKTVKFTILPKQVKGVKVKSAGYNSISISWSKYNGVGGYRVYRAVDGVHFICIATIENNNITNYTNTSVVTGKQYYYKVRSYKDDASGKRYYGEMSTIITGNAELSKVTLVSAVNSKAKSVILNWNKVSGASGYEIYETDTKVNGKAEGYKKIATITSGSTVTYTRLNLKLKKTYYYKVRAYRIVSGKKVYADYSNVKGATIKK